MSPYGLSVALGDLLGVGLSEEESRALEVAPVSVVPEPDLDRALRAAPEDVDLVVLGAGVRRPVAAAQTVRLARPLAALLVLVSAQDEARVRREISYAPGVPAEVEIGRIDRTLADRVQDLLQQAAVRRRHQSMMTAISQRRPTPVRTVRPAVDLGPLLEHAPVGVLVCEPTGTVRAHNPRAAAMLGLRAVDGPPRLSEVLPDAGRLLAGAAAGPRRDGDGAEAEVLVVTPEGRELEVAAVPTRLDQDRDGVLLLLTDVTDRRRVERDRERLAVQVRLLSQVTETMVTTLDLTESLDQLSRLMVSEFAEWSTMQLADASGELSVVAVHHRDPAMSAIAQAAQRRQSRFASGTAPSQVAARGEGPLLLARVTPQMLDERVEDEELRELFETLGVGSVVAVPLPGRQSVLGSMVLVRGPGSPPYTEEDVAFALEAGRRAGVALDNARLYGLQYGLSAELQRSLLTEPPQLEGGEIAVRYVAAADEAQVGGDWYDAFQQPDGSTVLVVGDVMGHDRRAAAAMSQVRGVLRGIGYTTGAEPGQILARTDQALTGLRIKALATAVVVRLEPGWERAREVEVTWSSAGHPAPMVLEPGGGVSVLGAGQCPAAAVPEPDLLLGLEMGSTRSTHRARLARGSTLLLFTDGLVERRGEGIDAGLTRLSGLLAATSEQEPLALLCDRILAGSLPGAPEDDVVLAALRLQV